MAYTKNFKFPTDEELSGPNVNISYPYLKAGALQLAKYCEPEFNEYTLCKDELLDPRKCLNEGKAVSACALKYFCNIKKHCAKEFEQFATCLNRSCKLEYQYCRKTQAIFDKCVLDKMGIEKPPFGWQAEVHIHHSDRPKPEKEIAYYPDAADKLPLEEMGKLEDPKYGLRQGYPRY